MKRTKTLHKIKELLANPEITANDVAEVIAEDQVLAENLINLTRSFGFPPEACTVSGAIMFLGFDTFRSVIADQ